MRARNIKPGFFLNEDLADIEPPWGRILFAGLWCMADREGRLDDRPRRIKAEVFPYDDKMPSIEKMLSQLTAKNFIIRYEVNGDKFIQINKFKSHQNPHNTERQSTLPSPPIHENITVDSPLPNGGNLADSLIPDSLIPDSLIPERSIASPESPTGDNGDARPAFLCPSFEVDKAYFDKLLTEYPALTELILSRELNKMGDWLTDNPKKHKRTARGHIKNPKMFIRNWIERMDIKPGGDKAWYE